MTPARKKATPPPAPKAAEASDDTFAAELMRDLSTMIESAREQVASVANAALTLLHWQVGHHVRQHVLEGQRAAYADRMVSTVSRQLAARYGRGFDEKSMRHMLRFAEAFPDLAIVSTASRQLSWSHLKVLTLDGDDYVLDLLFFHRRLRRLIAVELKIGDLKPEHSGQMELYLRWLDRYERQPSEDPPLGIILCAGRKRETVELLGLDARGIHVAEYLTELPPKALLEARLHRAIELARQRLPGPHLT